MEDTKDYLELLSKSDSWSRRHILAAWACLGIPESMIDFGCGTGAMVELADKMGVDALGIDVHKYRKDWYVRQDLSLPYSAKRTFQMVVSFEVAEHIIPAADTIFGDTLAEHVADDGLLIFSAAHPGQEGEGHVNTRPAVYWRTLLYNKGLHYQEQLTARLVINWLNINSPLYWLAENVQIFSK